MTIRLLTYNIRKGGAGREALLANVMRSCAPDVVLLDEATRPDVVERLAGDLEMRHWGSVAGRSLAFMSRVPMAHHAWHRPRFAKRAFLELVPEGTPSRLFGVHLSAVHSYVTERRRVRELRGLLASIERHQHGFHLVAGDFNTLAPGALLDARRLPARLRPAVWMTGGVIRWETIRLMLDAGYVDGYRAFHPTEEGYTFPTWDPHVRLDYMFVPAAFADRLRSCGVVTDAPGVREASDHFPMLGEVDLPS